MVVTAATTIHMMTVHQRKGLNSEKDCTNIVNSF